MPVYFVQKIQMFIFLSPSDNIYWDQCQGPAYECGQGLSRASQSYTVINPFLFSPHLSHYVIGKVHLIIVWSITIAHLSFKLYTSLHFHSTHPLSHTQSSHLQTNKYRIMSLDWEHMDSFSFGNKLLLICDFDSAFITIVLWKGFWEPECSEIHQLEHDLEQESRTLRLLSPFLSSLLWLSKPKCLLRGVWGQLEECSITEDTNRKEKRAVSSVKLAWNGNICRWI